MKKFGWQNGMYIFAGIMLLCILFGAIMKPLKPQKVQVQQGQIELQFVFTNLFD
jgi:hypothetical protein